LIDVGDMCPVAASAIVSGAAACAQPHRISKNDRPLARGGRGVPADAIRSDTRK